MNSTVKTYTKTQNRAYPQQELVVEHMMLFMKVFLFTFFYFAHVKVHAGDWTIDLSRRQTDFKRIQNTRMPASNIPVSFDEKSAVKNDSEILQAIKAAVNPLVPSQEIVIIQNESGFVPNQISLKANEVYKIHIVNLNTKEKNVTFLMDSFSQAHNTVYGVEKSFTIQPKLEGVFSYQSPETGAMGKLVIVSDPVTRKTASQKED